MNAAELALAAAGIGATGAIAGQLVAGILTARRETKRIDWERERWIMDAQADYRRAELERKTALYGRINSSAKAQIRLLQRAMTEMISAEELAESEEYHDLEVLESSVTLNASDDVKNSYSRVIEQMLELSYNFSVGYIRSPDDLDAASQFSELMSEYRELSLVMERDLREDHSRLEPR